MAKETIKCTGGKLTEHTLFIEGLFTGPGIRLERINRDFIEIRVKRHYPRRLINEKVQKSEAKLKDDGRI